MRKGQVTRTEIFKYITVAAIIVYVVLMMIFASGSTKAFSEVAKGVEASLDTKNLEKQDSQALKRYYGLNSADYDGVLFYSASSSMSAEEVLMIKVKNDDQIQGVRDAINTRIANRKNDFDGYAPKQVQLLDSAQLKVRGDYIFLAVAPKADEYLSAFSKSL